MHGSSHEAGMNPIVVALGALLGKHGPWTIDEQRDVVEQTDLVLTCLLVVSLTAVRLNRILNRLESSRMPIPSDSNREPVPPMATKTLRVTNEREPFGQIAVWGGYP